MFAVYCQKPHSDDPMAGLVLGDRPEANIPEGWVRVKVTHASLNRHDIFTLRGLTSHAEGITYPMILGNDGAGTLDDGTPVVIYPVMGSADWRGDGRHGRDLGRHHGDRSQREFAAPLQREDHGHGLDHGDA